MDGRKEAEAGDEWVQDLRLRTIINKVAAKVSRSPGFSKSDEPDIEQELILHLLQNLSCYDSSRASKATFVTRVANNQAATIVRAARAQKRGNSAGVLSLDDGADQPHGRRLSLAQVVNQSDRLRRLGLQGRPGDESVDLRLDIDQVTSTAAPPLKLLAAVLSHVPQFAASEVLGISRRKTAAQVAALREHFEASGMTPDGQSVALSRM